MHRVRPRAAHEEMSGYVLRWLAGCMCQDTRVTIKNENLQHRESKIDLRFALGACKNQCDHQDHNSQTVCSCLREETKSEGFTDRIAN